MKVIFLDIDGVLWTGKSITPGHIDTFERGPISELNRIMRSVDDLHIVISSTWRIGKSLGCLQVHFEDQGFLFPERMISVTPDLPQVGAVRGNEIQEWLDKHEHMNITSFVILDDDSDMLWLKPRLVKTSFHDGLTKADADEIIRRLNDYAEGQAGDSTS